MISTGQLDGERALKPKYALKETQRNLDQLLKDGFKVHCAEPTPNLFYFDGVAECGPYQSKNLCIEHFLPRGAILRGTEGGEGVLALCLYTGPDSKLI